MACGQKPPTQLLSSSTDWKELRKRAGGISCHVWQERKTPRETVLGNKSKTSISIGIASGSGNDSDSGSSRGSGRRKSSRVVRVIIVVVAAVVILLLVVRYSIRGSRQKGRSMVCSVLTKIVWYKQCKSRRCWEVKLSPREVSKDTEEPPIGTV